MGPMPPPEPSPPTATRPGPTDGPPEPPVEVDGAGEAVANGSEGSGMDALTLGSGIDALIDGKGRDALTVGSGSEALIVGSGRLGNGTGSEGRATPLDWFAERSSTASPHACCIPAANTAATRNVIEAISRR